MSDEQKTIECVQYHPRTNDIAIFKTDKNQYWIGSFDKFCTHTTSEPPYANLYGFYEMLRDTQMRLESMTGEE
jgi:hypothetical protein